MSAPGGAAPDPAGGNTGPLLAAVGLLLAGLATVVLAGWRPGLVLIAVAVLGAAAGRALLPPQRVGLLAVRSRGLDASLLAAVGLAALVLTVTLPG